MSSQENTVPSWHSIAQQLSTAISSDQFDVWIRPLEQTACAEGVITVAAPNAYHCMWVTNNFETVLNSACDTVAPGYRIKVTVGALGTAEEMLSEQPPANGSPVVNGSSPTKSSSAGPMVPPARETGARSKRHPLLDSRYDFESFVVGPSNQVAHASAFAVAQNLGRTFNPLFIAGAAGLGKTHLLHAIGHSVWERSEGKKRIFCLSAERFMNEYVSSIQRSRAIEFKEKYRTQCDLLLIDDVHTLAGKEGTQEEFFHIFNSLYDLGNQIVLTSDKYPKDMSGLEERLRSRFEWGLIADIQPPDVETRLAIIGRKSEGMQMELPKEVALYLATMPTASVRDLEGYLNRIRAFSQFQNKEINLDFVQNVLAIHIGEPRQISVEDIIRKVADYFGVRVTDMKSKSRTASLTHPRHVAMYLARELTELSFPELGQRFGGRNHATVMHACDNVRKKRQSDPHFAAVISALRKTCESA